MAASRCFSKTVTPTFPQSVKTSICTLALGVAAFCAATAGAADITMGFIYVGPKDDFGYNQAHALGKAAVGQLSGVKSVVIFPP